MRESQGEPVTPGFIFVLDACWERMPSSFRIFRWVKTVEVVEYLRGTDAREIAGRKLALPHAIVLGSSVSAQRGVTRPYATAERPLRSVNSYPSEPRLRAGYHGS